MTTIAWDKKSGLLAADRQCSYHAMPVNKLRRLKDGSVIGGAGDSAKIREVIEWMDGKGDKPDLGDKVVVETLRIYPSGRVEKTYNLGVMQVLLPYFAIGSGSDYAMGAMAFGASAREAVKIATKHDASTGGGIRTLAIKR